MHQKWCWWISCHEAYSKPSSCIRCTEGSAFQCRRILTWVWTSAPRREENSFIPSFPRLIMGVLMCKWIASMRSAFAVVVPFDDYVVSIFSVLYLPESSLAYLEPYLLIFRNMYRSRTRRFRNCFLFAAPAQFTLLVLVLSLSLRDPCVLPLNGISISSCWSSPVVLHTIYTHYKQSVAL